MKRVALVTGAAGKIGTSIARRLAADGHRVVVTDLEQAACDTVAKQCGADAVALAADLTDFDAYERLVKQTIERCGRVDVLVNNAAWRELVTMSRITRESWERTLRICLTAPAFLARWCAEDMRARRAGVIVNVTSLNSEMANGLSPAYAVAKGGLVSLTYELAALYGPAGLRVVGVSPGAVQASMSLGRDGSESDALVTAHVEDQIPLRRFGSSDEVASAIAWAASDEASYLHGTIIDLDGGWRHHSLPYSLKRRIQPGAIE